MTREILLLLVLGVAAPAHADLSDSGDLSIGGKGVIAGTMTVQGNAFSVGGATLTVIGGKVGIGTSSPGTVLDVNGATTVRGQETVMSTLTIQGNAFSVGISTLVVTGGNVGIGTANPGNKLTVAGGDVAVDINQLYRSGGYMMIGLVTGNEVKIGADNPSVGIYANSAKAIGIDSSDMVMVGAGGTPLLRISTGTYTPTLTLVLNMVSTATATCTYTRIGNIIDASCMATAIDPSVGSETETTVGVSLPVSSNFTSVNDCLGLMATRITPMDGAVRGNSTSDVCEISFAAVNAVPYDRFFSFKYTIK